MFRSRRLSGANRVQALMIAGMFGFLFLGTLYVQRCWATIVVGLALLGRAPVDGDYAVDVLPICCCSASASAR